MASNLKSMMQVILDFPYIGSVRRNHGLEHATLHMLSQRFPEKRMAGHSDANGFWLLGELKLNEVNSALGEAKRRLAAGDGKLAVHANCGTNFVTSGMLSSLAAFIALFGAGKRSRDKWERLPIAAVFATIALILAQPLGLWLQKMITTSSDVSKLEIMDTIPTVKGRTTAFRVLTHWNQ